LDNARRADTDEDRGTRGAVALVSRFTWWLAVALQAVGP
jgi:hypothetical protein